MSRIKNIIFDFGDVFINLDKAATARAMQSHGFRQLTPELDALFKNYEQGLVDTAYFLNQVAVHFPKAGKQYLKDAWNSILLDFPEHRLVFLENLVAQNRHKLFLLSNTNELHMECVKQKMGMVRYERFKSAFDKFYLSYEMGMRKPNQDIFEFVLQENNLRPNETFFVDDTPENTEAASKLGIRTWHLKVGEEEITQIKRFL